MDSKQVDPEPDKRPLYPPPPNPEKDKDGKEVSQEDKDLQEKLDLAVERLEDASMEVRRLALELLRKEIRESTRCVAGRTSALASAAASASLPSPPPATLRAALPRASHPLGPRLPPPSLPPARAAP